MDSPSSSFSLDAGLDSKLELLLGTASSEFSSSPTTFTALRFFDAPNVVLGSIPAVGASCFPGSTEPVSDDSPGGSWAATSVSLRFSFSYSSLEMVSWLSSSTYVGASSSASISCFLGLANCTLWRSPGPPYSPLSRRRNAGVFASMRTTSAYAITTCFACTIFGIPYSSLG